MRSNLQKLGLAFALMLMAGGCDYGDPNGNAEAAPSARLDSFQPEDNVVWSGIDSNAPRPELDVPRLSARRSAAPKAAAPEENGARLVPLQVEENLEIGKER